jgi:hypothetical protein
MVTRSLTAITLGLLVATAPAMGADRQEARTAVREVCKPVPQGGCMMVRVEAGQMMADHGADAGEAYDFDGNAVDRYRNVVAVPATRDKPREVFATPVGVRF